MRLKRCRINLGTMHRAPTSLSGGKDSECPLKLATNTSRYQTRSRVCLFRSASKVMIWAISSIIGLTLSIQIPLSTLSGRVLDQGSHTVADVTVDLLQKTYDDDGISDFRVVRTMVT